MIPGTFRGAPFLVGLLALGLLGGCGGDPEPGADVLRQVEVGTLKGEVYRALGPGPVDSTRFAGRSEYGYPQSRFLVDGETVEVIWIPQPGFTPGDSLDWRGATPVLFRNIAMVGWGWDQVEPMAEQLGLTLPQAQP